MLIPKIPLPFKAIPYWCIVKRDFLTLLYPKDLVSKPSLRATHKAHDHSIFTW